MTRVFQDIDKNTPYVATHAWTAQAAVHAGMKAVVNAIPDNYPMALHLAEGALHTVQTPSSFMGYKTNPVTFLIGAVGYCFAAKAKA